MTGNDIDIDDGYRMDRRATLKLASAVGLGAALSGTALADDGTSGPEIDPERSPPWEQLTDAPERWAENRWFVEFGAPPSVRGGSQPEHADERARLRSEADDQGVAFHQQRDFTTLWNGLSVEAELADAYAMSGLESVEAVYPVALVDAPEPGDVSPEMRTAAAMTGADAARLELGYTGDGVSVGIVDTGIDYNHPDLGGDGDPGEVIEADEDRRMDHPRITHGWDYVGPALDDPSPNSDPMDPRGHGTHVAGIAGAAAVDEEGVTGVAPETDLGAYKVFPADGATTADIIVEALEDAYVDGMDVVNMSIGASLQWGQQYPTTATSNELVAQGVAVTNSAGNDADLGVYTQSPPGNAHDAINVASVENEFFQAPSFVADGLEDPAPYDVMTGADAPPIEEETPPLALPAVSEEGGEEGYFGCQPEDFAEFPEGHVALIERGHCTFAQKYENAVDAGAAGVIIFNESPGLFFGTIADAGVEGVWGVSTSREAGLELAGMIEAGEEVRIEFTDETAEIENPDGGLLSGFSSYGQTVELVFGPNVSAPGGSIRSTYPLELDEYAVLSGTSMAAPHTAGAAALVLESEGGDLDPIDLRDRLQCTAEPMPWSLNPAAGLDHSFRQGAGLIQVDRAIEAGQRVEPGHISAGDGEGTVATLTIHNDGSEDVEYAVGHEGTLGTAANPFTPSFLTPGSELDAPETVTVPAAGSAEVDVTIHAPAFGWPNHQYGGYVTLTPDDEEAATLRVPYSGYEGDYQDLPLLGYYADATEFVEQEPRLAEIVGEDEDGAIVTEPVEAGHEFTIHEGDYPVIEAFFGHFPHEMRVYAVHQPSGQERLVMEDSYLPRSESPDHYQQFPWPGTTSAGRSENLRPVPSGTYTLRVELLRAMGDPENPDHWDTWESPAFELDTRKSGRPSAVSAPGQAPADASD